MPDGDAAFAADGRQGGSVWGEGEGPKADRTRGSQTTDRLEPPEVEEMNGPEVTDDGQPSGVRRKSRRAQHHRTFGERQRSCRAPRASLPQSKCSTEGGQPFSISA